jgi:helix-turn-helix protein
MLGALPMDVRQHIIELKNKGNSLQSIVNELHLCYATVQRLWKRYKAEGVSGLSPHYNQCGPAAAGIPRYAPLVYRAALWLKRCPPDWGAALIQLSIKDRYSDVAVPSERTLQRWFKAKRLYKPKSRFPLLQSPPPARQVHDVWQIDAKEKLYLGAGQKASYLSVVDEKSGSLLRAMVFPPLPYQ